MKVPEEVCKGETGTVRPAIAGRQTNNCFPLLATGGPPGVIQRSRSRGIDRQRRNPLKPVRRPALPGFPSLSRPAG